MATINTDTQLFDVINPATEEVVDTLRFDTTEEIEGKYKTAKAAQLSWAKKTVAERVAIIKRFSELLGENSKELSEILTAEMGKPLNQSSGEINGASGRINFFLENSEKWLATETVVQEEGLTEKIAYEPLGVIANISAWNYPYLVGVNVFVPALIAGNAVLYKPSEFAALTGLKIGELLHKAGVPAEVFQVVVGAREAGEALLKLPMDGYYFTGSYRTGQYIYNQVAPKMVPCQLELGGKDPMYVADDNSDVRAMAVTGVEGAFYNNGQSCCAVERIYVHENIYDDFIKYYVEEAAAMKMGDGTDEGVFLGPLSRKEQIKVIQEQVDDAVNKGAKVLLGGKPAEGKGYFFEPTVLVDVDHSMLVMKEESFGPIIGIQKVKSDDEAVSLMQDTDYGLAAAVYTQSQERAENILKQIDTGTAYWNCCDRVSAYTPWAGRKNSGIGATLSYQGIRAFAKTKAYHFRG